MTDKAKKLVEAFRTKCEEQGDCNSCAKSDYCYYGGDYAMRNQAADLIEFLAAELEQVKQERYALSSILIDMISVVETYKRERDAYFESMKGLCATCKKAQFCVLPPGQCPDGMWQWRGVKEG